MRESTATLVHHSPHIVLVTAGSPTPFQQAIIEGQELRRRFDEAPRRMRLR